MRLARAAAVLPDVRCLAPVGELDAELQHRRVGSFWASSRALVDAVQRRVEAHLVVGGEHADVELKPLRIYGAATDEHRGSVIARDKQLGRDGCGQHAVRRMQDAAAWPPVPWELAQGVQRSRSRHQPKT